jgi:hypothetical protein
MRDRFGQHPRVPGEPAVRAVAALGHVPTSRGRQWTRLCNSDRPHPGLLGARLPGIRHPAGKLRSGFGRDGQCLCGENGWPGRLLGRRLPGDLPTSRALPTSVVELIHRLWRGHRRLALLLVDSPGRECVGTTFRHLSTSGCWRCSRLRPANGRHRRLLGRRAKVHPTAFWPIPTGDLWPGPVVWLAGRWPNRLLGRLGRFPRTETGHRAGWGLSRGEHILPARLCRENRRRRALLGQRRQRRIHPASRRIADHLGDDPRPRGCPCPSCRRAHEAQHGSLRSGWPRRAPARGCRPTGLSAREPRRRPARRPSRQVVRTIE